MEIISYRPYDDQFWIACNKEETEKWFIPHLDDYGLRHLNDWFEFFSNVKSDPERYEKYEKMVKTTMEVDDIAYAYFNVSRDLSVCHAEVAHFPFHQLWNGYSPFHRCDHITISDPLELKDIIMTFQGKPIERN